MKTRSTVGVMAKLFAVLIAFTLVAAACGGDDGESGGEAEVEGEGGEGEGEGGVGEGEGESAAETGEGNTQTGEGEVQEEEGAEAVRGGTLRIAVEAETDGLNPTANNFAVSAYTMGYPVFDPLFYFDTEGNWFPFLAESATPVGDGSAWQVKLREGILFHDGNELNADAVITHVETSLADPIISLALVPNFPAEGAKVEKIDEYTVQFNLVRPWARFPVFFASQLGMIASPEWLAAAADDETLNQRPIGTGPYKIQDRTQDASTLLVRNEDYWRGTDNLHLDAIEVFISTDTALAAEQLSAGDLDVVITTNADAILTLRDAAGVSTLENVFDSEGFTMMNTAQPPFDDIRARQALTFSADIEGYRSLITQGVAPPADSMYHPDSPYNNPDVVQEGNSPELAGPLVESYCADFPENCTDGKINMELQFSGPSTIQTRIMDLLSASWEEFFQIERQQLPQDQHITQVATGQWQAVTWRQFGEVDPHNAVVWLECATATGLIALNWPRWCSEDRDALLFEMQATEDQDRRVEIMQEVQEEMNAAYTYIFFDHTNWTIGFRDAVKNLCGQTGPGRRSVGPDPGRHDVVQQRGAELLPQHLDRRGLIPEADNDEDQRATRRKDEALRQFILRRVAQLVLVLVRGHVFDLRVVERRGRPVVQHRRGHLRHSRRGLRRGRGRAARRLLQRGRQPR